MTCHLSAVSLAATRPQRLTEFWAALLGREPAADGTLPPGAGAGAGFRLRFAPVAEPKVTQNRAHFDLTSAAPGDQERTVARALEPGARHTDVGQRPEEGHVVLADPEGNEFCVIEAGNRFLDGCGFIGALSCDGSRAVGYFWSAALGWPLVWDEHEETAIQSPRGGPKITWGGPPLMPRTGPDRVRFELTPAAGGDPRAEVDRLVSLGATRIGPDGAGGVELADPDGTVFRLLPVPAGS